MKSLYRPLFTQKIDGDFSGGNMFDNTTLQQLNLDFLSYLKNTQRLEDDKKPIKVKKEKT